MYGISVPIGGTDATENHHVDHHPVRSPVPLHLGRRAGLRDDRDLHRRPRPAHRVIATDIRTEPAAMKQTILLGLIGFLSTVVVIAGTGPAMVA